MKKILGLGNALVDVLIKAESDAMLAELNLPKGSMQLIDAARADEIANTLAKSAIERASGGSAANTIHGATLLGASSGYIGRVGKDEVGDFFTNDLKNAGIEFHKLLSDNPSGQANTFVTPDSERTFATYLGAAVELSADDLDEEIFKNYHYFHIEGYLVQNYDLVETALKYAKRNNVKVSIDLASYNIVEEHKQFLGRVLQEYVDIVFANEEEAKAFANKEPGEALELLGCYCEFAVVKTGATGSLIKHGSERVELGVVPCTPVDTTGAGDNYAAGFLYGLSMGYDIRTAGEIGALMAGRVIEHYGARLNEESWAKTQQELKSIVK